MSDALIERRRLFNHYAANLSRFLTPDSEGGTFACPICLWKFKSGAVEPPVLVNRAHVYPEQCGYDRLTLTCARCNSETGSRFDSQLSLEHATHDAAQPDRKGSIDIRLKTSDGDMGATFTNDNGVLRINEIAKQTNPRARDRLTAAMIRGDDVSLDYEWVQPDRHRVALLHSAYLCLFYLFGYEPIIYGFDADRIRSIIKGELPPPDDFPMFVTLTPDRVPSSAAFSGGVGRLLDEDVRFLVAILPTPEPGKSARAVLLPGVGDRGRDDYAKLRLRSPGDPHFAFEGRSSRTNFPPESNDIFYLRHLFTCEWPVPD